MAMPSDTEMVPNSRGYPPAENTPSLTAPASRSSEGLHVVLSFHELATPICGLAKSSSPSPTARSIPRAAVFSRPSVTSRLRGLMSGVVVTAVDSTPAFPPGWRCAPPAVFVPGGGGVRGAGFDGGRGGRAGRLYACLSRRLRHVR